MRSSRVRKAQHILQIGPVALLSAHTCLNDGGAVRGSDDEDAASSQNTSKDKELNVVPGMTGGYVGNRASPTPAINATCACCTQDPPPIPPKVYHLMEPRCLVA